MEVESGPVDSPLALASKQSSGNIVIPNWNSLEILLLVSAANRHGIGDWSHVASELSKRSKFIGSKSSDFYTPEVCEDVFNTLLLHFNESSSKISKNNIWFLEEVKKAGMLEIKNDIQMADKSIEYLQNKITKFENKKNQSSLQFVEEKTDFLKDDGIVSENENLIEADGNLQSKDEKDTMKKIFIGTDTQLNNHEISIDNINGDLDTMIEPKKSVVEEHDADNEAHFTDIEKERDKENKPDAHVEINENQSVGITESKSIEEKDEDEKSKSSEKGEKDEESKSMLSLSDEELVVNNMDVDQNEDESEKGVGEEQESEENNRKDIGDKLKDIKLNDNSLSQEMPFASTSVTPVAPVPSTFSPMVSDSTPDLVPASVSPTTAISDASLPLVPSPSHSPLPTPSQFSSLSPLSVPSSPTHPTLTSNSTTIQKSIHLSLPPLELPSNEICIAPLTTDESEAYVITTGAPSVNSPEHLQTPTLSSPTGLPDLNQLPLETEEKGSADSSSLNNVIQIPAEKDGEENGEQDGEGNGEEGGEKDEEKEEQEDNEENGEGDKKNKDIEKKKRKTMDCATKDREAINLLILAYGESNEDYNSDSSDGPSANEEVSLTVSNALAESAIQNGDSILPDSDTKEVNGESIVSATNDVDSISEARKEVIVSKITDPCENHILKESTSVNKENKSENADIQVMKETLKTLNQKTDSKDERGEETKDLDKVEINSVHSTDVIDLDSESGGEKKKVILNYGDLGEENKSDGSLQENALTREENHENFNGNFICISDDEGGKDVSTTTERKILTSNDDTHGEENTVEDDNKILEEEDGKRVDAKLELDSVPLIDKEFSTEIYHDEEMLNEIETEIQGKKSDEIDEEIKKGDEQGEKEEKHDNVISYASKSVNPILYVRKKKSSSNNSLSNNCLSRVNNSINKQVHEIEETNNEEITSRKRKKCEENERYENESRLEEPENKKPCELIPLERIKEEKENEMEQNTTFSESKSFSGSSNEDFSGSVEKELELSHSNWNAKRFLEVIQKIEKERFSHFFKLLPDKKKHPDYSTIIKQPIDIKKIRKKISESKYLKKKEFIRDIILLFTNALVYFKENSIEYNSAIILKNFSLKIIKEVLGEESMVYASSHLPSSSNATNDYHTRCKPMDRRRSKQPRYKELNSIPRDMREEGEGEGGGEERDAKDANDVKDVLQAELVERSRQDSIQEVDNNALDGASKEDQEGEENGETEKDAPTKDEIKNFNLHPNVNSNSNSNSSRVADNIKPTSPIVTKASPFLFSDDLRSEESMRKEDGNSKVNERDEERNEDYKEHQTKAKILPLQRKSKVKKEEGFEKAQESKVKDQSKEKKIKGEKRKKKLNLGKKGIKKLYNFNKKKSVLSSDANQEGKEKGKEKDGSHLATKKSEGITKKSKEKLDKSEGKKKGDLILISKKRRSHLGERNETRTDLRNEIKVDSGEKHESERSNATMKKKTTSDIMNKKVSGGGKELTIKRNIPAETTTTTAKLQPKLKEERVEKRANSQDKEKSPSSMKSNDEKHDHHSNSLNATKDKHDGNTYSSVHHKETHVHTPNININANDNADNPSNDQDLEVDIENETEMTSNRSRDDNPALTAQSQDPLLSGSNSKSNLRRSTRMSNKNIAYDPEDLFKKDYEVFGKRRRKI